MPGEYRFRLPLGRGAGGRKQKGYYSGAHCAEAHTAVRARGGDWGAGVSAAAGLPLASPALM